MKSIRHYVYLNDKRYDWNDREGDYIYAFTPRSGNSVVKRWREEVAKLNSEGAAQSVGDDVDRRKAEERLPLELMRSDEYNPRITNYEELKKPNELNIEFDKLRGMGYANGDYPEGYKKARTHKEAMEFLSEQFHIEVDGGYRKLPVDIADHLNRELIRFRNVFGTVGFIDKVIVDSPLLPSDADAGYEPNIHALLLRSDYQEPATDVKRLKVRGEPVAYQRSTGSSSHVYRHEIAHAFYHFVVQRFNSDAAARAKELHTLFFEERNGRLPKGIFLLSKYAQDSEKEMFAEAVAQIMDKGAQSSFACAVVKYVIFGGI